MRMLVIFFIASLLQVIVISATNSNASSAAATSSSCPYSFRLYVYPLPESLPPIKLAIEARQNKTFHICQRCIYEQFALEYIVHDYFTQVTQIFICMTICERINKHEAIRCECVILRSR